MDKVKSILKGLVQGGFPQYLMQPYFAKIQAGQETEKEKNALVGKMIVEGMHDGTLRLTGAGISKLGNISGYSDLLEKKPAPTVQPGLQLKSQKIGEETYTKPEEETVKDKLTKDWYSGKELTREQKKLIGVNLPEEDKYEGLSDVPANSQLPPNFEVISATNKGWKIGKKKSLIDQMTEDPLKMLMILQNADEPTKKAIKDEIANRLKTEVIPKETPPPIGKTFTTEDLEAIRWADSNPNDPRASQIKNKLGVK